MGSSGGLRTRWLVTAAIALVAQVAACAGPPGTSPSATARPSASEEPSGSTEASTPPSSAATAEPGPTSGPGEGVEGLVAYGAVDPAGVSQVHLLDIATATSRQLTHLTEEETRIAGAISPALSCPSGIHALAWSPDGAQLAFSYGGCTESVIFVAELDGSHRRIGEGAAPAWSPDGARLAFAPNVPWLPCAACVPEGGPFNLRIVDIGRGGAVSDLTRSTDPAFRAAVPIWSPDGSTIAFHGPLPVPDPTGEAWGATHVIRSDGTDVRFSHHGWATHWLPDGRLVIRLDGPASQTLLVRPGEEGSVSLGPDVVDVAPSGSHLVVGRLDLATGTTTWLLQTMDGAVVAEIEGGITAWDVRGARISSWRISADWARPELVVYGLDGSGPEVFRLDGTPDAPGAHAWQP